MYGKHSNSTVIDTQALLAEQSARSPKSHAIPMPYTAMAWHGPKAGSQPIWLGQPGSHDSSSLLTYHAQCAPTTPLLPASLRPQPPTLLHYVTLLPLLVVAMGAVDYSPHAG